MLVVNSMTVLLVFLLVLRLAGLMAATCAAGCYAVLSVSPTVLGFAGHATHFVVLMAMAGFLLLLKGLDEDGIWLVFGSGVFFGLAFLMKQPGLLLAIFGALYLVRTELKNGIGWKVIAGKAGAFSGGAALPFVLTCLWLWRVGVFRTFWFWTVSYASQYVTNWGLNRRAPFIGYNISGHHWTCRLDLAHRGRRRRGIDVGRGTAASCLFCAWILALFIPCGLSWTFFS